MEIFLLILFFFVLISAVWPTWRSSRRGGSIGFFVLVGWDECIKVFLRFPCVVRDRLREVCCVGGKRRGR